VSDEPHDDDTDRAAILARRKRWIALAIAGATAAMTSACPGPCLSTVDTGPLPHDAGTDADDPDAP
jgi:hypothetical protein